MRLSNTHQTKRARRAAAGLAALAVLASGVAGCAGEAKQGGSNGAAVGSEYDPSATIDATYYSSTLTLDPHKETTAATRGTWLPLYDTLFDVSQPGQVRPAVATSSERTPDGLTVTLKLRTDVEFHDGTKLDAEAVKASLERGLTLEGSTVAGSIEAIESMKVVDPATLAITLKRPLPQLEALLGGPAGALVNPVAIKADKDLSTTADGSGPYEVTEFIPETKITYARAKNKHWNSEYGKLAGFTVHTVANFKTAVSGVEAGDYDVSFVLGDVATLNRLEASGDFRVHDYVSTGPYTLNLRSTRSELGDVRVRQAINHAIDREAIGEELFEGDCKPSDQLYPDKDAMHVPDYDGSNYDVDRAKKLMAEADVSSMDLGVHTNGTPAAAAIAEVLEQSLSEIGIKVSVTPGQPGVSIGDFRAGNLDSIVTVSPPHPHPLITAGWYFMPGGSFSLLTENEATEPAKLVEKLSAATLTEDQTASLDQELGKVLNDLSVLIPVCNPVNHALTTPKIGGFDKDADFMPFGILDLRSIYVAK